MDKQATLKNPRDNSFDEFEQAAIDHVIGYIGNTTKDWFLIKGQIMKLFPPQSRNSFSRRHEGSTKQFVNDFEKAIIAYWEAQTGIKLEIDESRLHREESWPNNPKGWGLVKYNEERRRKKEAGK